MSTIAMRKPKPSRPSLRSPLETAGEMPMRVAPIHLPWKRWFDGLLALVMLVPGLPLLGLLILVVRWTSRGPGIYRQVRVGRGGRLFTMYKLRSMSTDAETRTGAVWAKTNDPRVTPVGQILRKLHLDEIPQLFNVLKGEMSLVGPRPERPEFVELLSRAIPGYVDRLAVLPGITGLAQINLPPDTDLDSVRRKLVLDRMYIRETGLWMDLRLLTCTLTRLVKMPEPLAVRLFGLYREIPGTVGELPTAVDASPFPTVDTLSMESSAAFVSQ